MKRRLFSIVASLILLLSTPVYGDVKPPKGFDKKVFDASLALLATSESAGVNTPKFICTVTAYQKVDGGYLLIGAGHCTPLNSELPEDMKFYVSRDLDSAPIPVQQVVGELADDESVDFFVFYLPTKEKYQTISLGDDSDLRVGDKTVDVNYSLGAEKITSPGVIVSQEDLGKRLPKGYFLVQQFDSHGASGSAVVSEKSHKIVGLVIAGWDGATMPSIVESIDQIKMELQKYNVVIGGKTHQLFVQKTVKVELAK